VVDICMRLGLLDTCGRIHETESYRIGEAPSRIDGSGRRRELFRGKETPRRRLPQCFIGSVIDSGNPISLDPQVESEVSRMANPKQIRNPNARMIQTKDNVPTNIPDFSLQQQHRSCFR